MPYDGGFCEWYYTLWENIQSWPFVNPITQELLSEPTLKSGKSWFGPIKVPNSTVGFKEEFKTSAAGLFYEIKVDAFQFGDSRVNRPLLENMVYHKYVLVGKLRSGGFWILIGNQQAGLSFGNIFNSGVGAGNVVSNDLSFYQKAKNKALILPSFNNSNSIPAPGGGSTTIITVYDMELVALNQNGDTEISWTTSLSQRFGNYPTFEIWATDATSGDEYNANFNIDVNNNTNPKKFIIRNGGVSGTAKIT